MTSNDPRYHVTVDDRRTIKIDHVVGWCSVRWRHIQTLYNAKLGTRPASQQQAFAILKIINLIRKLIFENFKFWGLRCQGRYKIRKMYVAKLYGSRGLNWIGNDAWVVVSFLRGWQNARTQPSSNIGSARNWWSPWKVIICSNRRKFQNFWLKSPIQNFSKNAIFYL